MDEVPKSKQRTTIAFAQINVKEDQSKFGDSTHVTGEKPLHNKGTNDFIATVVDDNQWFQAQYAENIGVADGKNPNVEDVVKKLFANRIPVPESDTYAGPVNPKTDAHLFTWPNASLIKKCLCGDSDCTCKGCTLMPPKQMPTGPVDWIDWDDLSNFKSRTNVAAGTLIPSLRAKIREEIESSSNLMPEGSMVQDPSCPEFCGSRCVAFKIPGADEEAKYWYTPEQIEKLKKIENTIKQQNKPPDKKRKEKKNAKTKKNKGDVERK